MYLSQNTHWLHICRIKNIVKTTPLSKRWVQNMLWRAQVDDTGRSSTPSTTQGPEEEAGALPRLVSFAVIYSPNTNMQKKSISIDHKFNYFSYVSLSRTRLVRSMKGTLLFFLFKWNGKKMMVVEGQSARLLPVQSVWKELQHYYQVQERRGQINQEEKEGHEQAKERSGWASSSPKRGPLVSPRRRATPPSSSSRVWASLHSVSHQRSGSSLLLIYNLIPLMLLKTREEMFSNQNHYLYSWSFHLVKEN